MNHIITGTLAAVCAFAILFGGCNAPANKDQPNTDAQNNLSALSPSSIGERAERPAFKGIELYSWQNESGQWCFSLLYGTNRNKLYSEVTAAELTIVGVTELKTRLGYLAKGENVIWLAGTYEQPKDTKLKLTHPPDDIIKEVIAYGKQQEITVVITNRYAQER